MQQQLVGKSERFLGIVSLANIVADKMGWPSIEQGQFRYREFAKQYLVKYRDSINANKLTNPKSWVYFIQEGENGHVKVGVSDDVDSRLLSLQTSNPRPLRLVAKLGCSSRRHAFDIEGVIHKKMYSYNVNGEWFANRILNSIGNIFREIEWQNGENLSDKRLFKKVKKHHNSGLMKAR